MDAIVKRLMENHKLPEKMCEAYKIRYSYEGDELSDYEGNVIVVADSEDEAIEKAEKEYPEGWNFRVEDEISDVEEYKKRFPKSNIKIIESVSESKLRWCDPDYSIDDISEGDKVWFVYTSGSQTAGEVIGFKSDKDGNTLYVINSKRHGKFTVPADKLMSFADGYPLNK